MKLPDAGRAIVDRRKIEDYLLSLDHPTGAKKARAFAALGYHVNAIDAFRAALLKNAIEHAVTRILSTPYGTKYVLEGYIDGPSGRRASIRSVWIHEPDAPGPRLVTAYPLEEPS